ncbi:MAG: GNAT family N-acetyltransferase [Clostridia bacterium]|nr:GNAT family N-acetyltransferase [Clostridia bacterium]
MKILQTKISDKENSIKYVLDIDGEIVGCGYIINRDINPIEVYIDKQHQSNGYGKSLFLSLLDIVRQRGVKGMIFELPDEQYRFKNIILQAGAEQLGRNDGLCKFILKIN